MLGFQRKVNEEYFGGRDVFYRGLMDCGLISNACGFCGSETISIYFEKGMSFPRAYCKECKKRCPSLRSGSIFERYEIENVPAFVFVCNCFIASVPFEATVLLSGLDGGTVRRYLGHVSELIDTFIDHQNKGMEGMLGCVSQIIQLFVSSSGSCFFLSFSFFSFTYSLFHQPNITLAFSRLDFSPCSQILFLSDCWYLSKRDKHCFTSSSFRTWKDQPVTWFVIALFHLILLYSYQSFNSENSFVHWPPSFNNTKPTSTTVG